MLLALIGGSLAFAGVGDSIHRGVDLWMTVAGFAQTSFAKEPIPAGFFCAGSQPFTGKIVFQGAPLAASPAGSLGSIDTAVRRLDDATFNAQGEATTRIQLLALSLVSVKPIATSCGPLPPSASRFAIPPPCPADRSASTSFDKEDGMNCPPGDPPGDAPMKNLPRTLMLLAALTLVGAASGRALGHYRPGDCVYQCENEAGQDVNGSVGPLSPENCCAGNYPHACPSGYSWTGTLFYVDSFGPELCGF